MQGNSLLTERTDAKHDDYHLEQQLQLGYNVGGVLGSGARKSVCEQHAQKAKRTSPTMSDKLAVGSDGALLPVNSVRCRQAHCTGSPLATQPGPVKACLELFQ
jgi:hypothetical protein